jgi:soluble lytic murein transglycosylase
VKEIQQAASRAGIPAPLLFGLVREESTFEPRAVSPQRAVGLTQVIWETATDMARLLRIKLRGRKDLFQPRINAMLGGRFLANLVRLYRGRSLLAVAAYNAGPGNVDRWLANRGLRRDGPVPEDEIVEDIPFEETRLYVRKVFGSFAAYAHLYYGDRIASAAATWDGALAALLP